MKERGRATSKRISSDTSSEARALRAELAREKLGRRTAEHRVNELELKVAEQEREIQRLNEQVERLLIGRSQTEEMLQKTIRKLEKDVAERDVRLEEASKQISWFQKHVFGERSEQGVPEASSEAEEPKPDPPKDEVAKRNRGQQPGSDGHGRSDRSAVQIAEVIPLEIPGGCSCRMCGKQYTELADSEESRLFEHAVSLYQNVYERRKYVSQCDCEGKRIVVAPPPPKLYNRTDIGNSLWVHLVVQKFLQSVPTNRTLKELRLMGFHLAEGTVTGGLKKISGMLETLYEGIVSRCRGADLWNGDETHWRVFDGKSIKAWLWLVASEDAVVYLLDSSRSSRVPKDFFAGSTGTLMTDRYSAYKALEKSILNAWCWVHVRRDFRRIYDGVGKLEEWARSWLEQIGTLFALNQIRFRRWENQKTSEFSRTPEHHAVVELVQKLKKRWQKELRSLVIHPQQKKILQSLKRHWQGLTLFLTDPRIPLHNNRAERLLRNAVLLRKNSYGSGTCWTGELAAKLFSIIQTWLINGLDPYKMLQEFFDECSKTPGRAPPTIEDFLPWTMSSERKLAAALPSTYSRPG